MKDHTIATSASISSLLEPQNALSQRLTALEANQDNILENQSVIMNLLCEFVVACGNTTDDVPKGEKRKRETESRRRDEANKKKKEEEKMKRDDAMKKKKAEDKCKRSAKDGKKDDNDDYRDNQPLIKRVRLAGYRRSTSTT